MCHYFTVQDATLHHLNTDEGITLHGKVPKGVHKGRLDSKWIRAIKSCLFTWYHVDGPEHQDQFWKALPDKFNVYKQITITNGDRIHAANYQGDFNGNDPNHRDATFIWVSGCCTLCFL